MNRDQLIQHIRKEIARLGSKKMQEEKTEEPKFMREPVQHKNTDYPRYQLPVLQTEEDLDKYLFYLGKTKEEKI